MISIVRSAVAGQFGAGLSMLHACIESATPESWQAPVAQIPFWHVAYHVLFYADLYLSSDEHAFRPQPFHQEGANFLSGQPKATEKNVLILHAYEQQQLLDYLDVCRANMQRTIESETEATLAAPSGFSWLEFTRLELHVYNIRHLEHHVGQLAAALRRFQGEGVDWVRSQPS